MQIDATKFRVFSTGKGVACVMLNKLLLAAKRPVDFRSHETDLRTFHANHPVGVVKCDNVLKYRKPFFFFFFF